MVPRNIYIPPWYRYGTSGSLVPGATYGITPYLVLFLLSFMRIYVFVVCTPVGVVSTTLQQSEVVYQVPATHYVCVQSYNYTIRPGMRQLLCCVFSAALLGSVISLFTAWPSFDTAVDSWESPHYLLVTSTIFIPWKFPGSLGFESGLRTTYGVLLTTY